MADYLVSGKKALEKAPFVLVLFVMRCWLEKVSTNLDIKVDRLVPFRINLLIRLPDRPSYEDMLVIGQGQSGVEEENNGVIVLDECSSFLNSRSWNDKGRQAFLDWIIHSRKYGWDTYFIAQQEQLDKQLRTTQLEYHIAVKNTAKWPIPFVTPLVMTFTGIRLTLPKMHLGIIKQGMDRDSLLIGRKWLRGVMFSDAYDTQQIFCDREHSSACGIHTVSYLPITLKVAI